MTCRHWTISVNARAVQALYTLPRGVAGLVTDAIDRLLDDPTPAQAEVVEGLANVYRLSVGDHVVEYEVAHERRVIKILNVA
jgi:mRNA-degrading endonuclease RelE of RelBE toxin-antitoxin system